MSAPFLQHDDAHPEFAKLNMDAVDRAKAATARAPTGPHPLDSIEHRFVGEVDLPEKEEPLLKENLRRFVLFPIKFNEVRMSALARPGTPLADFVKDLAVLQEG